MKVKIGDVWYDSEEVPICIQVTAAEKELIYTNPGPEGKFASAPDTFFQTNDEFRKWMST